MGEFTAGVRLTDQQRLDWLRLIRSENVGPRSFRTLLNRYGGARAALEALPDLARRGGAARAIRPCSVGDAERELAAARNAGIHWVALGERDYPPRLRAVDDAPPLLTVRGATEALTRPIIAIVGSRNASAAGLKVTEQLARDLAHAGFVIASGLARGIDAVAHRASLTQGTMAVLAGGHQRIYPPEHIELAKAITEAGCLISEMPLDWEPRARDFPRRNRLISGVAIGVVVVEAAQRSGSLITARMAAEQGREVFAVPGSPLDPRAEGTNGLIKQGATLVTGAVDILDVVQPMMGAPEPPVGADESEDDYAASDEPQADERSRIISLLGPSPVALDDLIRLSGAGAATVRIVLLELELAGRLTRPGGGTVALV